MKEDLIILGAGGHAKAIIDLLTDNDNYNIIGCIDKKETAPVLGIPVMGDDRMLDKLYAQGVRNAFVALGSNAARKKVSEDLLSMGYRIVNAISPKALISKHAHLGQGVAVMPGAVLNADCVIGNGAIINTAATVGHDTRIGAYCHVAPGCNVAGFTTIGEGCFLGVASCVIDRVTIGDWITIGGGGVVIRDMEGGCTAVGVPVKVIKHNG